MRQRHRPEPPADHTEQSPVLKVCVEVREVSYEQMESIQRAAWDWLWQRLLGPIPTRTHEASELRPSEASSTSDTACDQQAASPALNPQSRGNRHD